MSGSPPARTATPSPNATRRPSAPTSSCTIKPDTDEEKYSEYLESYRLHALVKKYSDYIRYPIRMLLPEQKAKEGSDPEKPEYETVEEMKTVNSMVPLWQRKKSDVTEEEYNKFYSELTHEFDKPQRTITVSAEGSVTYKALLFVPSSRPFNFYTEGYEKGLQLYSAGVLIMDSATRCCPTICALCAAWSIRRT